MKKHLPLLIIMSLLFAFSSTAYAQGSATSSAKAAQKTEKFEVIAKRKADNAAQVYALTIKKLQDIADRVEARIAKLKAAGVNTASSETSLSEARQDLEAAKAKISVISTLDLSASKAQENFKKIKTAAAESKEFIKKAQQNLMLSVVELNASSASARSGKK